MEMVYSYGARSKLGKVIEGLVIAEAIADAERRIREIGHEPVDLKVDWRSTMEVMFSKEINKRELGRFYLTLGKRLAHGANVVAGLEQAVDFVTDPRLKTSLSIMREAVMDGSRIPDAMRVAGLPIRDAAAVRALEQAGKLPEAFKSLGEESLREFKLRRELSSLTRTPIVFTTLVYVFTYVSMVVVAPKMKKFLLQMPNMHIPPFAQAFYDLSDLFNSNLPVATVVYLALGIGFIWYARSRQFKKLVYRVPMFNRLSQRSDMGALWSGYGMLYGAGVNISEASKMMGEVAQREDSRDSFDALANALQTGVPLDVAVRRAGFPDYVCKAVSAAVSSGDVHSGIEMLGADLAEDVSVMTTQIKQYVENSLPLVMGAILAGFFMVTLYPIMSGVLSQV